MSSVLSYFDETGLKMSLAEEIAFVNYLGWNTIPQCQQRALWDQGVAQIRCLVGAANPTNTTLIVAEMLELNVPRFAPFIVKTIIEFMDTNPNTMMVYVDLATKLNTQATSIGHIICERLTKRFSDACDMSNLRAMSVSLSTLSKFIYSGLIDTTMVPVMIERILFQRRMRPQNQEFVHFMVAELLYSSLPNLSAPLIITMVKLQTENELPCLPLKFLTMIEDYVIQSQRNSWNPQPPYWAHLLADPSDWRRHMHQMKVLGPFDTQYEMDEFGYEYNFIDNEKRYYTMIKPRQSIQKRNLRPQPLTNAPN